jgi:23S rRNA pseudouridine1911/1915/1917 synthase
MGADEQPLLLIATEEGAGRRLDRYLAEALPELSRTYIQQLIDDVHILVNGRSAKASYQVQPGDQLAVTLPLPTAGAILPEAIPLSICYEDDDVLVVDKPAGMVVHPAPGHASGTLVNALLHYCPTMTISGDLRPGIIHRLDKDTSGLLVVAKNDLAKTSLQTQQKARQMRKLYSALVHGHFDAPEGLIDAPIDRHTTNRLRRAVLEGGREARTHYRQLELLGPFALLEARLETGRTHQIRVHFSHLGHPVVADQLYALRRYKESLGLKRQFLHARLLGFAHPRSHAWVELESPLPAELQSVLDMLRRRYAEPERAASDQDWYHGGTF